MQTQYQRLWQNPKVWLAGLACYWLTLLVATHLPQETPGLPKDGIDKVVHLAAFALLAAILTTTWQRFTGRLTRSHLVWMWLAIVLYAAFDEWTQQFVGRYSSTLDWLADVVGAALGLILWAWLRSRKWGVDPTLEPQRGDR